MNKFSKMMGVTALSMSLTVPALAEVSAPVNNNEQVQNELAYAFGENTDLQAKAMTGQDMKDTQGAFLPYVGAGLVGGYFGYMGYVTSVPANQRTSSGYALAVGSGSVGGALTLTPIGATRAAFVGATTAFVGNQAAIRKK